MIAALSLYCSYNQHRVGLHDGAAFFGSRVPYGIVPVPAFLTFDAVQGIGLIAAANANLSV